jgi:predicted porin
MRKLLFASAAVIGLTAGVAHAARFAESDPSKDSSAFGAPQAKPAPGKIIARVGGNVWADFGVGGSTLDRSHTGGPTEAKLQPYGMTGGMRLYFGVDGQLTNGILYGANYEIRTNQAAVTGASPSGNSTANTLYTRRAYVYIGSETMGLLRVGQGDGVLSLFNGNSTGEFYSTGAWDGDVPGMFGNAALAWPFAVVGAEYTSEKIAYVSPSFAGFQLGVSFAPSTAATTGGQALSAFLGGSDRQSSSFLAGDLARARNIFEVGARYQGKFGAVGIDGMVGYTGSGVVDNAVGGSASRGLSVFDVGLSANIVGFQPYFHLTTGVANGVTTPQAKLASGRRKDELAWVVGMAYGQGPWVVGAGYYVFESQGSSAGTGNRYESGFNVGGNYNITNGLDLYLEYLYGTRKQSGFNFETGGAGAAVNKTVASGAQATIQVRW